MLEWALKSMGGVKVRGFFRIVTVLMLSHALCADLPAMSQGSGLSRLSAVVVPLHTSDGANLVGVLSIERL